MPYWSLTSGSPEETRRFGACLGRLLQPGDVLALAGDLGSGKTCLAQGVAAGLGVPEDEPVTSPTYTLVNHYRGRFELYHFDFYRLESVDELDDLGFDEYLCRDGVVLYEWSQRFSQLDLDCLRIELAWRGDEQRAIELSAGGSGGERLLEAVRASWLEQEVS